MVTRITDEQRESYARTARERFRERRRRVEARRQRAWAIARRAADLLRDEFGASRVALFGSLAGAAPFHDRSDIDLAVWGLRAEDYYRALSRLLSLDPAIAVDLVDMDQAETGLQETIQRQGTAL